MHSKWLTAAVIVAIAVSAISLTYFSAPFVWLCLAWLVASICGVLFSKKTSVRMVWVYVAVVFLAVGIYETYLWLNDRFHDESRFVRHEGSYTQDYYRDSDLLGYGPLTGVSRSAKKYYRDELIYDVDYSIDSTGLRVGPPTNGSRPDGMDVMFFGGSVTFGEGVEDDEAMPYLVGETSIGKYCTHNFAFHGYGPHQMLAIMENERERDVTDAPPAVAVYQCIIAHVMRAAGLASWDKTGPRYVIENGRVSYAGSFDGAGERDALVTWLSTQAGKSYIHQRIFNKSALSESNIDLFVGIVDRARDVFEERYPGSEFHVIFWDNKYNRSSDVILEALEATDIPVHLMSHILEKDYENDLTYRISPHDLHPNPRTHRLIAGYVLRNILGAEATRDM